MMTLSMVGIADGAIGSGARKKVVDESTADFPVVIDCLTPESLPPRARHLPSVSLCCHVFV